MQPRRSRARGAQTSAVASFTPGDKGFLECSFSRLALLDGQNGAPTVVIDDRDVEPGALFQQFHVALYIVFGRGGTEEEESGDHLRSKPRQRLSRGLLGRFHQNAR